MSSSFAVLPFRRRTRSLADDLPPVAPKPAPERLSGGGWLIVVFLVLLLIASFAGLVSVFLIGRFPVISMHGWIAFGLMWLSFYSSRHGFDDRADPGRKRPESQ